MKKFGYITLLCFFMCTIVFFTINFTKKKQVYTEHTKVEEVALDYIEKIHDRNVIDVINSMEYIEESRIIATKESIEESIYFAESERQSIKESIVESEAQSIAEAESIAESIEESRQAYIKESIVQSIAAAEAESRKWAELIKEQIDNENSEGISIGRLHEGYVCEIGPKEIPGIRKLFENTVVIGDSRAKGIVDTGILTEANVSFYGGAVVYNLFDTAKKGANKMKKKALFMVGLNDLGGYHGDSNRFANDLKKLIKTYLSINPKSKIYIQDILPVKESGRYAWPMMDYIPDFNKAIEQICDEMGYTFVKVADYASPSFVNSNDGAHYGVKFYYLWAQAVANQMGLWGDLR